MAVTHTLPNTQRAFAFDRAIPPVLEIDAGDTVVFETNDNTMRRLAAGETFEQLGEEAHNAVTGPVAVRGATPGDALRIDILDIEIDRAWSAWIPGFGRLGARTSKLNIRQTPIEAGRVRIAEHITVPYRPMIGCIGLAPAEGVGSTMRPCLRSGGNMDLRELSPETTIWLPVEVPGALLSVGDYHAAMGRGEPTSIALEACGRAHLRIDVENGSPLTYPRIRNGTETICIGMGETHHDAYQSAVDQAFEYIIERFAFDEFDAYAYVSAAVEMRLGGPASPIVLAVVPDPTHD